MSDTSIPTPLPASRRQLLVLTLCIAALGLSACRKAPLSPDGRVLIVEVQPGGSGELVGLRKGDRIVELRRASAPPANPKDATLRPTSCLALVQFEIEQGPRGPVEIDIERGDAATGAAIERKTFVLAADDWRLRLGTERSVTADAKAWDHLREAAVHADAHDMAKAETHFAAAERFARKRRDERFLALIRQGRAIARIEAQNLPGALADIESAIAIRKKTEPGSLALAQSWAVLGRVGNRREDFAAASSALNQARSLQAAQAPGSLVLAYTENTLGTSAAIRGDSDAADRHYTAALAITERKIPNGRLNAALLLNLGTIAWMRSRLDLAERYELRALAHWRRIEPNSERVLANLLSLGNIARDRGDLDRSDELLRTLLESSRAIGVESTSTGGAFTGLGLIAQNRGNFTEAEARHLEALRIYTHLAPEGPSVALTLTNLAKAANAQGASSRAERYGARALSLHRKSAPGSPILAFDLINLAEIAMAREDAATARGRIAEAFRIVERLPHTLDVAEPLRHGSSLLFELGAKEDLRRAEAPLDRALEIYRRVAPGTPEEAEALGLLGRLKRRQGRTADADRHFTQAFEALDRSVRKLGGSDLDEARFRAQFALTYQEAIELEIEIGQPERAYQTLERFRARSLLDLLSQRDLAPPAELPTALAEEIRRVDAEIARFEGEIAALDPATDSKKIETAIARRARAFGERENLRAKVRRISPRYAAITAPVPLDLAGARRTLVPGELGLSFSAGERNTILFVVMPEGFEGAPPSGLAVHSIPLGRRALGIDVAALRSLVLGGQTLSGERALRSLGARLYEQLLAPAAPWLEQAERLRISADGPLAALPFGALVAPAPSGTRAARRDLYLAERWPISTVVSATLAAELDRMRGEQPAAHALVAFGDPHYPARLAAAANRGARPSSRFRMGLGLLPASRVEVQGVAGLFRPAISFLGADATEARFLTEAPKGNIVHFAGHALLDSHFPLDSALALSPPSTPLRPGDDGLLQAWEIFERLRLTADLVTLSACETALGPEAQGEGLLGLTRAFHYAGARTVLSSLWSVSDRSTAELMRRFYRHLGAGAPKDVALATAQREMISGPYRAPYHWAAFQLDGDWR